ncbi:hypothetical protein ABT297_00140 [Dactylosporangium sp. NPDC000555]|uniref:hypothetical protein n=1 Tax=Dactylosporangium sp. NPDC000555 TaxID=3154260 RepID=UPI00332C6EFF
MLLARSLTAVMVAGLLTGAMWAAARWSRHRVMVGGMIVGVTPMTFHLAGAINPNAVEIAAGVALFAGLIPLFDREQPVSPGLVRLAGVAGIVLAMLRGVGTAWLFAALVLVALPLRRSRLAALWQSWVVRRWLAVVVVAAIGGAAWTLAMRVTDVALSLPCQAQPCCCCRPSWSRSTSCRCDGSTACAACWT